MSDIFREVDEALQEDKVKEFWQEWGSTLIISAIAMVLTTGIFSGVRAWQAAQKEKETSRILQAMDEQEAIPALLEIAENSKKAQQSIAIFAAATLYLQDRKFEEAAKVYEDGIKNDAFIASLEDLARIMSVRIRMGEQPEESAGPGFLETLAPALKNEKSPWYYHATAEAALIEAEYNNDYKKAVDMLGTIVDADKAPRDLKERAAAMQHVFGIKAEKAKSENEKQEG